MTRVQDIEEAHKKLNSKGDTAETLVARLLVEISFISRHIAEIADHMMPREDV